MDILHIYVSVPVACFRVAQAREFWETYPCPPPSTIYGMLLSLVGEENRLVHQGTEIAIALISKPQRSVVLRTLWRIKNSKVLPGLGSNKRPDFQELLTDIRLSVWVRLGQDKNRDMPLVRRLNTVLTNPSKVSRFGGLSLGESTHLVDEVRIWRSEDPSEGWLLISDEKGDLSFPVWPDHVGSRGTLWGQFQFEGPTVITSKPPETAWISICSPNGIGR